ncbi:Hypothetical predicted protein [Pelobates cultripes]|uniref:Uncharacterized protein n=1 Tax=Pelobates cultripes TaxID=61616 RepID=A0AAD1SLM8_PELCU|nr:Hypothetical predicted protein [Pelobates cultripes]
MSKKEKVANTADTSAISTQEYTQGQIHQSSGDRPNYVTQDFLVVKIDAQLAYITKQITNSFTAIKKEIADLSLNISSVEGKISKMEEQLTTLQGANNDIDNKVYQINMKLRDLEDRSRHCNLWFRNIPEDITHDQLKDFLRSYFQEMNLSIQEQHTILERTHRLPKPKSLPAQQQRDIITCFHPYAYKEQVVKMHRDK